MQESQTEPAQATAVDLSAEAPSTDAVPSRPREIGGPQGLEPTRYGDWEKAGRCIDF
jgi:hypothetical protein